MTLIDKTEAVEIARKAWRDGYDAAPHIAALPARGVGVKPLVFSEFSEGGCMGRPYPFQYFITQGHNGRFLCHHDETWHDTLPAAQANAQADYQRAALAPAEAGGVDFDTAKAPSAEFFAKGVKTIDQIKAELDNPAPVDARQDSDKRRKFMAYMDDKRAAEAGGVEATNVQKTHFAPVRVCPICDIADCATHRDAPAPVDALVKAAEARRDAARLLWDMLYMQNGAADGMTQEEAQAIWAAAKAQTGFAAVNAFLAALRGDAK